MNPKHTSLARASGLLAALLVLAGCSLAPTYQRPEVSAPALAFKEAAIADDNGSWPNLPEQVMRAASGGKSSTIRHSTSCKSRRFRPTRTQGRRGASGSGTSAGKQRTRRSLPAVGRRLRPDPATAIARRTGSPGECRHHAGHLARPGHRGLRGRSVRRVSTVANAVRFDVVEQNAALFQSTLLALQADVAQAYFMIRELDATQALYADTVRLVRETLALFQRRHDASDVSEPGSGASQERTRRRRVAVAGHRAATRGGRARAAILLGRAPADFVAGSR